jgi:hypothetical protein
VGRIALVSPDKARGSPKVGDLQSSAELSADAERRVVISMFDRIETRDKRGGRKKHRKGRR